MSGAGMSGPSTTLTGAPDRPSSCRRECPRRGAIGAGPRGRPATKGRAAPPAEGSEPRDRPGRGLMVSRRIAHTTRVGSVAEVPHCGGNRSGSCLLVIVEVVSRVRQLLPGAVVLVLGVTSSGPPCAPPSPQLVGSDPQWAAARRARSGGRRRRGASGGVASARWPRASGSCRPAADDRARGGVGPASFLAARRRSGGMASAGER
jgi:hypothetical protein